MRTRRAAGGTEATFVLVFQKGDDPVAASASSRARHRVGAARFTGHRRVQRPRRPETGLALISLPG